MKGKYIMTIAIGITALVLTYVMFVQFKTIEQTDITAIETMRETELRAELSNWKSKYEEMNAKVEEDQAKVNEYKEQINNNNDATETLRNEANQAKMLAGYTDVSGEGIEVKLEDTEYIDINETDILKLVNELWVAGAEAICVNDERIVSTTDIALVNGVFVLVNGNRLTSPYTIKAIGDKKYLESAITIKGGFLDEMTNAEKMISYKTEDNLTIPKYNSEVVFQYAEIKE